MNNVAYIGKIINKFKIPNADSIESLEVICGEGGKWRGTAKINEFEIGELCEVYLQDALLPDTARYSFMRNSKFIVKMRRFLGVPSECLIMPLTVGGDVGDSIVGKLGITKYEKPIPGNIAGLVKGNFPTFIPKTDEPNFQRCPELVKALRGNLFYATVKMDGSSATVYYNNGEFGCCSRNLKLKETGDNAIWQIAMKYNLEEIMKNTGSNLALQFEIVGPGIQKNPLKLTKVEPRLFNIYNIDNRRYLDVSSVKEFSDYYNFPMADIIDYNVIFDVNSDYNEQLQKYAEGTYSGGKQREGIVIRPMQETLVNGIRLSFKVINLLYK